MVSSTKCSTSVTKSPMFWKAWTDHGRSIPILSYHNLKIWMIPSLKILINNILIRVFSSEVIFKVDQGNLYYESISLTLSPLQLFWLVDWVNEIWRKSVFKEANSYNFKDWITTMLMWFDLLDNILLCINDDAPTLFCNIYSPRNVILAFCVILTFGTMTPTATVTQS